MIRSIVLSAFSFLVFVSGSLAQSSATGASMNGTVRDTAGAPISNATVTLNDLSTNHSTSLKTDTNGYFHLVSLSVSTYEVKVEAVGFQKVTSEVSLALGRTTTLDIELRPSDISASVDVSLEPPAVDVSQTAAATSIERESIEELPINSRDYLQFALLAPGVGPSTNRSQTGTSTRTGSALGDSGFTFGGLRARSNTIMIDGLTNIDETTGASLIVLSPEIVREFQVVNNGISAEFGGAAGGSINVITKTGSNEYHGTAFAFIQNEHLNARNPIDATGAKLPFRRYQPGISIGGPIRRDKLFFYVAAEDEALRSDDRTEIARSLRTPINAALAAGFAPRSPVRTLSGDVFRTGADETELAGKVTWIADATNVFNLRFGYTNNRIRNEAFNLDSLADPTARGSTQARDHQITSSWTRAIGSDKVNELRGQFSIRRFISKAGISSGPQVDIVGLARFGRPWDADSDRREDRTEIVDSFTISHKMHEVKFGGGLNRIRLRADMPNGSGGLYIFAAVADFLAARPAAWRQAFGAGTVNFSVTKAGVFVQDRITLRPTVTVNFGARYDIESLPLPFRSGKSNFAPRLGVAWSPAKDLVIRGGFGLFYDRLPLAFLVPALQRNGVAGFEQAAFDANAEAIFNASGGGTALSAVAGIAPSIYRPDPVFKTPYSVQAFAGIEKEITKGTVIRGEFLFTHGVHLSRVRNINLLPPVTLTAANAASLGIANPTAQQLGRVVFGPARIDTRYNAVYQLENSSSSRYRGLSVAMQHRFSREATALASYTLSRATDDASDMFEQPANPYALQAEIAPSSLDVRHRLVVSGVFELPFGDEEKKGSARAKDDLLTEILSDIEVAPIVTLSSGRPYTPLTGMDEERSLAYPFASRPAGMGRNSLRTGTFFNTDLRVVKYVPLRRSSRLDLAFEFFNVFNHPNAALLSPYFGSGATPLFGYGRPTLFEAPRQFRFSLDLEF